jgi:hypothetical protein
MWARLAGAVEDFDLLLSKETGREGRGCQAFFLALWYFPGFITI